MRTITLEEHFTFPEFLLATGQPYRPNDKPRTRLETIISKLLDTGPARLADMDANGIDLQVLSLSTPGLDQLDAATAVPLVRQANDRLAAIVVSQPQRFAGFAILALQDPQAALLELQRCIHQLHFKGWIIMGTLNGIFLDDQRFLPLFEAAQSLDVPIYLHPGAPPKQVSDIYHSGFPANISFGLSHAGWGWHAEAGLHGLRLMLSGLFDRFPKLKIIVGHMGDHLPFNIARADRVFGALAAEGGTPPFKRRIMDYFRENFFITTSGYFDLHPFNCALGISGADRLLFSVDYPYGSMADGRKFLDALPITPGDREKISHLNAERLLHL